MILLQLQLPVATYLKPNIFVLKWF